VDLADSLAIVIPQLRLAFNSCQIWKKLEALEVLREMAQVEGIGQKLVPFFRILLPPLSEAFYSSISLGEMELISWLNYKVFK
jgi:hypothetical protein